MMQNTIYEHSPYECDAGYTLMSATSNFPWVYERAKRKRNSTNRLDDNVRTTPKLESIMAYDKRGTSAKC